MTTPAPIHPLSATAVPTPPPLTRHEAYRQFLCVDCRVRPYSAGRPRCDTCHELHLAGTPFVFAETATYAPPERISA